MNARSIGCFALAFLAGIVVGGLAVGIVAWANAVTGAVFVGPEPQMPRDSFCTANGVFGTSRAGFTRWTRWIDGGWEWIAKNEFTNPHEGWLARWSDDGTIDDAASGEFATGERVRSLREAGADVALASEPPWIVQGEFAPEGWPVGETRVFDAAGRKRIEATHSRIGMAIRTYYVDGAAQYAGWYDLIDGMRGTWNAWGADGTRLADFEPRSGSSDLWSHEIGEVAPGRGDLPPLPDLELLWNGPTTNFDDATLRLGRGSH